MTIVTRFPPSPTGFLHIGNARTALFNWCFARKNGGKFLLRIEDTDKARSTPEAIDAILKSMEWLNLDYDNDTIVYQSENEARHREVALQLLEKGLAYKCYASQDELEAMREEARQKGEQPKYNGMWRDRPDSDAPADRQPVIRIKAPLDGASTVHDAVQGDVTVQHSQLDDFIILRADGSPTYMLAVVVDDHDMGVNWVIRGDDHLNNVFRQKVIYDAMGWDLPNYAHLPLLHGEDGSKFSKRHGALGVLDYADMGYLPEALFNMLMRLGWSHGDDELFTQEQAKEWFSLENVNKSPARFDIQKLNHINAWHMQHTEPAILIKSVEEISGQSLSDAQKVWLASSLPDLIERSETLHDLTREAHYILHQPPFEMDEKASKTLDSDEAVEALKQLSLSFQDAESFDAETLEALCKEVANTHFDGKLGKIGMPLRVALTGTTSSPAFFKVAAALGKEETLKRIEIAINHK